jgi:hypothetical protein
MDDNNHHYIQADKDMYFIDNKMDISTYYTELAKKEFSESFLSYLQENKTVDTFNAVIRYGNVTNFFKLLQWLKDNEFPWSAETFSVAASGGDFFVMQWLKENGCPMDENTFIAGVETNDLGVLKWLKANGCPWSDDAFTLAVEQNNFKMVKWLAENGCPWNEDTFDAVFIFRNLKIIKCLLDYDCPYDKNDERVQSLINLVKNMNQLNMNL